MEDISIVHGSEDQLIFIFEIKRPINTSIIGHKISIKKLFMSLIINNNLRLNEAMKSLQNLDLFS